MKKKQIPAWVWIAIAILTLLIIAFLFSLYNDDIEEQEAKDPMIIICKETCDSGFRACNEINRVLDEGRDCDSRFEICMVDCRYG